MTQKSLDKFTNYKLSQMMEGTAFNAITQILETQAKLSPDTAKSMALETIIRKAIAIAIKYDNMCSEPIYTFKQFK